MADSIPSAASGLALGEAMLTAQRKQRNDTQRITLEGMALDAKVADQNRTFGLKRQEAAFNELKASFERMGKYGEAAQAMGPNFKTGSPLDKAIDREKNILAKIAPLVGYDPNAAQAAAAWARSRANIPAKPVAVPSTSRLVDPFTGKEVVSANEARILSPDEVKGLGLPTNTVVQRKGNGDFSIQFAPENTPTLRAQKIASLTGRGLDQTTAEDIVDGNIDIEIVPTTGRARLVNKLTQQVTEIPIGGAKETPAAGEQTTPPPTEQQPGPGQAFGALNWLKDISTDTLGQVFEEMQFPEVRAARTQMKFLREEIINALSKSGRPPVVEQARILETLPSLGPVESIGGAVVALKTTRGLLEQVKADDEVFSDDANQPDKLRLEAFERVRRINRVLKQMEVLDTIGTAPAGENVPEGVDPELWKFLTPEQQKLWQTPSP
ncbi:MAG: hypothetical protein GEU76_03935 [Alphaproteobacteria bacterium]|nr:hypothetical protein [Alphaproteobacteria bacterium]